MEIKTNIHLRTNIMTHVMQNTAVLLIGQFIGIILSFIASIFLVRSLGTNNYGQYALIYAFLTLFSWLASFGTDNIIVREAAKTPEKAGTVWSNGIFTQVVFSNIAFLGVLVLAILMGYSHQTIIFLIIASVDMVFLIPWRFASRVFQVALQQWRGIVATLTRQIVWIILLIILTLHPVSINVLLFARMISALLEVSIIWYFVKPFFKFRLKIDINLITRLIQQSWPLAINALSVAVYTRIDQVMIEKYLTSKDLGYYATAVNIAGMMSIIPSAFMASIFPLLCKDDSQQSSFTRMTGLAFRWLLIVNIGIAGILTVLGKFIIIFIYGKDFLFSGQILAILAWSEVAMCYTIVISQVLISQNLQKYLTIATFIGAIVNILGNIIFLPYYGVIGASWVTVFSYSLSGIFLFSIMKATRLLNRLGMVILLKTMLIGIIALFISIFVNYIIATLFFISIFTLGLILIGLVSKDDINLIIRTVSRPKIVGKTQVTL